MEHNAENSTNTTETQEKTLPKRKKRRLNDVLKEKVLDSSSALAYLNEKETDFVMSIAEGKTKTEAARDAGYASIPATKNVNAALAEVKRTILDIYDEEGIDGKALATVVKEGLSARVVSKYKEETEETDIPDHATRLQFAKLAHAIRGDIVNRSENKSLNLTFHTADEGIEEQFKEYMQKKSQRKEFIGVPLV